MRTGCVIKQNSASDMTPPNNLTYFSGLHSLHCPLFDSSPLSFVSPHSALSCLHLYCNAPSLLHLYTPSSCPPFALGILFHSHLPHSLPFPFFPFVSFCFHFQLSVRRKIISETISQRWQQTLKKLSCCAIRKLIWLDNDWLYRRVAQSSASIGTTLLLHGGSCWKTAAYFWRHLLQKKSCMINIPLWDGKSQKFRLLWPQHFLSIDRVEGIATVYLQTWFLRFL